MLIDDLFEQMSNTEDIAENITFVIDNDLRTISIPSTVTIVGVESDGNVTRLYFQMPRMYGEYDLSEFNIRINYRNTDVENELSIGDAYSVTDKQILDDTITFSWLVGRNACKYEGTTEFIVCLRKSDDEGNVLQEFNTTIAQLSVLRGLETTEQVQQEYPDILQQLIDKVDSTTGFVEDTVQDSLGEISKPEIDEIWDEVFSSL